MGDETTMGTEKLCACSEGCLQFAAPGSDMCWSCKGGNCRKRAPGERAPAASPAVGTREALAEHPMEHRLKCWPEFYDAVRSGRKTFEVRRDDRDFREGDDVVLDEWDPKTERYTGRPLIRRAIGYVARGACIPDGYCVFALATPAPQQPAREATEEEEPDCAACDDYDFVCEGCGAGFCGQHAAEHAHDETPAQRPAQAQPEVRRPAREVAREACGCWEGCSRCDRFARAIKAEREPTMAQMVADTKAHAERLGIERDKRKAIEADRAAQPSDEATASGCGRHVDCAEADRQARARGASNAHHHRQQPGTICRPCAECEPAPDVIDRAAQPSDTVGTMGCSGCGTTGGRECSAGCPNNQPGEADDAGRLRLDLAAANDAIDNLERELHYVRSHLAATQEVERKHANTIADLFERLSAAEALLPAAPPPGLVPVAEVVRWLGLQAEQHKGASDRAANDGLKNDAGRLAGEMRLIEYLAQRIRTGAWRADLAALDSATKETTDGK